MAPVPFGYSYIRGVLISPLARSFIASGMSRGLSVGDVVSLLRAMGEVIEPFIVRQVYEEYERASKVVSHWGRVGWNKRPSDAFFAETSKATRSKYTVYFEVELRNRETGQTMTAYYVKGSDTRLTRSEWYESVYDAMGEVAERYDSEIVAIRPVKAFRRVEE